MRPPNCAKYRESFMEKVELGELGQASLPVRAASPVLGTAPPSADGPSLGALRNENVASPSAKNVAREPPLIETFRRFSTADWIVAGTALFIICNGVSVCIGWWLHIPMLVQLFPDAPPILKPALFLF